MKIEPIDFGKDFKLVRTGEPIPEGWFICTDFPYNLANLTSKWKEKNLVLLQRDVSDVSDVSIVGSIYPTQILTQEKLGISTLQTQSLPQKQTNSGTSPVRITSIVDNVALIKGLMSFGNKHEFYFVQVIQRKKENPHLGSNNRIISTYYVYSLEQLDTYLDEMKTLCHALNARIYIHLNRRDERKVSMEFNEQLATRLRAGQLSTLYRLYATSVGRTKNFSNKTWIVDIDDVEYASPLMIAFISHHCDPVGDKVLQVIPTKSGIHLITKPFRLDVFKKEYPDIDVHKDNPTLMYA